MIEDTPSHNRLPPEMLASLLQTVRRKQQSGDLVGARVVLRALAAQQPEDPRIWLALATVVETRDEQRQALARALDLDPQNVLARRALERFTDSDGSQALAHTATNGASVAREAQSAQIAAPPVLDPAEPVAVESAAAPDDQPARAIRWPLYLVIGVAILLVLIVATLQSTLPPTVQAPTPTLALPGAVEDVGPTLDVVLEAPAPIAGQATPIAEITADAPPAGAPSTDTPPNLTALPSATAGAPSLPAPAPTTPMLPPGEIVVQKPWHASLLRPDYAVLLDGAIGTLQPRGRFVLALVVVGNDDPTPARIPADLFSLVDSQGNRYQPEPAASTAFLAAYGRGQRGDLSMEEEVPAGGGNVSVPLIFDVPQNARDLTLRVGDASAGWPVGATPALVPTATP
jgi:hypothetical protein